MGKRRPALERFMEKVCVDPETGCWNWSACLDKDGYGRFSVGPKGKSVLAHRWSYEHFVGELRVGLTIEHLCNNRRCVNPKHLAQVGLKVNLHASEIALPAVNARKTHCKHGHRFDEANTYRWSRGRTCRECTRMRQREYRERQRRKRGD